MSDFFIYLCHKFGGQVVPGDRENNGNYRLEIYNEYGDTKADAPINNLTPVTSSIKVTFTVSGMSAAAEAPAAEEAPAETAPAETAEAPETGIALAVVPAVIALAAAVISKRR